LEEKNGKKVEACESTVRNFVREIRKKHDIPKVMYQRDYGLKKLGLKISQIARALSLSRNTVYRYLEMNPDDLDQERERRKKLDGYTDDSRRACF